MVCSFDLNGLRIFTPNGKNGGIVAANGGAL